VIEKHQAQGTKHKEPSTRNQAQGTKHKEQGTRNKEQGTRNKEQGTRNKEPSMPPDPKSNPHMPQLDGLRALAVLAVLAFHWIPGIGTLFGASLGELGVDLFFVLSGFLITGILLDARAVNPGENLHVLRQFYLRRFLRIFPLYYATFVLLALLDIPPFRDAFGWHLLYLQNFYQWVHGRGMWGSHLWTLAVEEQFYLLWPFIVLFAPKTHLRFLLALPILVGPVFRHLCWTNGSAGDPTILLPGAVDTLALGGTLALAMRSLPPRSVSRLACSGLLLGGLFLGLSHLFENLALNAVRHTAWGLVFTWLIWRSAIGIPGLPGRLLESRPATYLGSPMASMCSTDFPARSGSGFSTRPLSPGYRIFDRLGLPHNLMDSFAVNLAWHVIFTFTVAILSWHLFEAPINRLKRFFSYQTKSFQPII
jgi:peptidoglycan/LPS O-acetylase OafA/YrhL